MNDDKTIKATITNEMIEQAEIAYEANKDSNEAMERLIGTFKTYGSHVIIRPNYSPVAMEYMKFRKVA